MMKNKGTKTFFITIIAIIIAGIGKAFGFIRELLLAALYGSTAMTDAYCMALMIPLILLGFLTSYALVYTPTYIEMLSQNKKKESVRYTKDSLIFVVCISTILIIIAEIKMPQIVRLIAPAYSGEIEYYTIEFSRVLIFTGFTAAAVELLIAYMRCEGSLLYASLIGLVVSPIEIALIIIGYYTKKEIFVLGPLIAQIVQLLVCMIFFLIHTKGEKIKWLVIKKDSLLYIRKTLILLLPVFVGSMASQLNTFVDKMFASRLPTGIVTTMYYSERIFSMINTLIFVTICTIVYPEITKVVYTENQDGISNSTQKFIDSIICIAIPLTVYIIIEREDIVRFIYERGEFGHSTTIIASETLALYSLGFVALGIHEAAAKIFYSFNKMKYEMAVGVIVVGLNIVLDYVMFRFGQNGLALATSISGILAIPIIMILLCKCVDNYKIMGNVETFIKGILAAALPAVILWNSQRYFRTSIVWFIIRSMLFVTIFVIGGYVLKLERVTTGIKMVWNFAKEKICKKQL